VKVKVDEVIPDVRPGFTCTAEITTATRQQVVAIPIQATTVREMVLEKDGTIARDDPKATKGRPGSGVQAAQELKPGQERKELEGVFVVKDNTAFFTPIKTGIAGEKYFEGLSGVNAGDQVIIGPFSSVRELRDGVAVKIEATPRGGTAIVKK
jgi:HlyD family secretion protein